jgi:membrane-bound lytic murein transglycosylase B
MGSGRGPGRVIAALAVLAAMVGTAVPAAAGDDAGAPAAPAVASAATLSAAVTAATQTLDDLQARHTALATELATATAQAGTLAQSVSAAQQSASALVASARQQALESYMQAEPAAQPFALVNALSRGDANDVAWSIGMLKVTHQQSLDRLREAETARGDAQSDLTAALSRRDAIAAQLAATDTAITQQQAAVVQAQANLAGYVRQLAPTTVAGMTTVAYAAYTRAATALAGEQPSCGLRWELLAAIGKTESNHGAGRIDTAGDSVAPIIGIPIGPDTDGGTLDGDPRQDHAVGPMQFIPSTWKTWAADGNGDGKADPGNIFDATLAAGRYLCAAAGPLTLTSRDGVIKAILAYNPNLAYLQVVGDRFEALAEDVAHGWFTTGTLPTAVPAGSGRADSGTAPSETPSPPPVATQLHTIAFFSNAGVVVQTSGDVVAASCTAPSSVLGARTGFARCFPTAGGFALDPCAVSPADPTLLACVSDPSQPARLARATAPVAAGPLSPAPPYLGVVLSGGDLCVPTAAASNGTGRARLPTAPTTPAPSATAASTTTTTSTTTAPADSTSAPAPSVTTSSTAAPAPTSTTAPSTTTTAATTTTTPTSTTAAPPAAPASDSAYHCASGATIVGQPDTTSPVWQALVSQPGVAPRPVAVDAAWG